MCIAGFFGLIGILGFIGAAGKPGATGADAMACLLFVGIAIIPLTIGSCLIDAAKKRAKKRDLLEQSEHSAQE